MKRSLLTLIAPFVLATSLHAAADYLLEIDGIKGESSDTQRPGTIEIESFSWGASRSHGGGGGAGKVSFSDLHVTAKVSKATPQLLVACATGTPIRKATLYVRKAGGSQEYYKVILEGILVSSIQQSGQSSPTSSDDRPTEEVAFYYNKVSIAHISDDGTETTGEAVRTPE